MEYSMRSTRLSDPSFIYFTPTCFIPISVPTCKHPFSTCAFVDTERKISRHSFKIQYVRNTLMSKKCKKKKKHADCWKESLEIKTKVIIYKKTVPLFKLLNRKSSCIIPLLMPGMSNTLSLPSVSHPEPEGPPEASRLETGGFNVPPTSCGI